MRDIAKMVRQGRKILKSNMRMDMQASEYIAFRETYDEARNSGDKDALLNLVYDAFCMGVAVGKKIGKKTKKGKKNNDY